MIEKAVEDKPQPARSGSAAAVRPGRRRAATPWHLYKPGQGARVRWGTAGGLGAIALGLARFTYDELQYVGNLWVRTFVPVALLVISGWLIFWLIGQNRKFVDFLIATEGELKKATWPSRREVIGATKVVIVTVFALAAMLFVFDTFFMFFFEAIGVLRVGALERLFGGGAG